MKTVGKQITAWLLCVALLFGGLTFMSSGTDVDMAEEDESVLDTFDAAIEDADVEVEEDGIPEAAEDVVMAAADTAYKVGDIIEFGSYPQSKVTDSATITALNAMEKNWISYHYYSGKSGYGSKNYITVHGAVLQSSNYMKYCDLTLNGQKYRAVTFTQYRPHYTVWLSKATNSYQDENGYKIDQVYYFRYEPLTWRVINPEKNWVISEKALDCQAFNNYIEGATWYTSSVSAGQASSYWVNEAHKYKNPNDWSVCSLRTWLNDDFYNTAFSETEKAQITLTKTGVSEDSEAYALGQTYDNLFLIHVYMCESTDWGFGTNNSRIAYATDYAKCQGVPCQKIVAYGEDAYGGLNNGAAFWSLRTRYNGKSPVGYNEKAYTVIVGNDGALKYRNNYQNTMETLGIRPAFAFTQMPGQAVTVCTVTFDANGGTVSPSSTQVNRGNTLSSLPKPTRGDSVFDGWYTAKTGGDQVTSETVITADMTVYAHWTEKDTQKPTVSITATDKVAASQTLTLKVQDNVMVEGYYWGTNSVYTNNAFSAFSGANVTVTNTVDKAGTYYLTAKDTSGNVSETKSVTLYMTTLNANGGSVSPTSVLMPSGKSFTLPTPTRSDKTYSFGGWYTDAAGSGERFIAAYTPAATRTLYAVWIQAANIYNLGDETYSFRNYADSDAGGHCFGMSATSTAYYKGYLDLSIIGGKKGQTLYSFGETATVKKPICYYQARQGSLAREVTVAGGRLYFGKEKDIQSDWKEVVDYVKSHQYDEKGTLQIGYRCNGEGHAINLLRYTEVNGQPRIYAYDNNFPTQETYFYQNASGDVIQTPGTWGSNAIDCIALRDMTKYYSIVDQFDATRVIYAYYGSIQVENAEVFLMDGEIDGGTYVMYEIRDNIKKVEIVPLVDNASFVYMEDSYGFGVINDDTYGTFSLATMDDNSTITKDANWQVYNEGKQSISISGFQSARTVKYKTTMKFHYNADVPEGSSVRWFLNDQDAGTSDVLEVKEAVQDFRVQVKVLSEDGKTVLAASESETVTVKIGFFDRLGAFFRRLFGIHLTIDQKYNQINPWGLFFRTWRKGPCNFGSSFFHSSRIFGR